MTSGFQLAILLGITLGAGMLMANAGLAKKMLSWKVRPHRCPICGRARNYECPSRR
jgi:hypothetical protein